MQYLVSLCSKCVFLYSQFDTLILFQFREISKEVKIFNLLTWPESTAVPNSTLSMLSLIDHVIECQQHLPENSPITVLC